MVGRLGRSFRSGDLAEDLGLLLLRGVAAVADVPRTEDVGADAVANLLRLDEDGNCYAEDSFLVQLKAESVETLTYEGHALAWLIAQQQPMFIGRVSAKESKLSLHTTLHVNQAALALAPKEVLVRFGVGGQMWPWGGSPDGRATVWLGPPVATWTLADLAHPKRTENLYSVLKRFLGIAQQELWLLSLGQCRAITWSANDPGSLVAESRLMKGGPGDLASVVERIQPLIKALLLHTSASEGGDKDAVVGSLLALVQALRDHGFEVRVDSLDKLAAARLLAGSAAADSKGELRGANAAEADPSEESAL